MLWMALEERLGLHLEAQLQAPFLAVPFAVTAASWIYIWGHWPVIVATMI